MRRILDMVKSTAICAGLIIGTLMAVCGVLTFPLVMMKAMANAWWLIGYLGYMAIGWVLYEILIKP